MDTQQTEQPQDTTEQEQIVEVGPCEAMFNQMMREVEAQARRAQLIATGGAKPQLNMLALLKGVMRGLDMQIGQTFGDVYQELDALKAENEELKKSIARNSIPVPTRFS